MARALDTSLPFTSATAAEHGITRSQLRGRSYQRIFHDIHLAAAVEVTVLIRALAALLTCDGLGHISHHTAAKLWGLWVPEDPNVHVSVRQRRHRTKVDGIKSHLAHETATWVSRSGLRLSSPVQTFLDLAKPLELVDLVVLADSLLHRHLLTVEQLVAGAAGWRGHCAKLARRAAGLAREGVESPMETRLRLLLVLAGFPEPVIAFEIDPGTGRRRIRLDLCYPGLRIAIEYDGRQHAESTEQWRRDLARREDLDTLGWRLVVVTWEDLTRRPHEVLWRVREAMAERGVAVTPAADDEWRRHFPGRPAAPAS